MNSTWWVDPNQLDDDQREVVKLGREGSFLILGPPGSGKTNLLLLRANYLCRADLPNVVILVFTRVLREFLVSGAAGYHFPTTKIQTYHSWALRLLWENGIDFDTVKDFQANRRNMLDWLREAVRGIGTDKLYDAILLDEVHDYTPEEVDLFFQLATNVFAVGDPRQKIYRTKESLGHIRSRVDDTKLLRFHYRNGIQICRLADGVMKSSTRYEPLLPTCNYNETTLPSSVQHFKCQGLEEQCERMLAALATQLEAYPDELIGVISPRHEELDQIKEFLNRSQLATKCIFQDSQGGYDAFITGKPICVSTLHSAKGLEFRALHFMGCDGLKQFPKQRNMSFTGITRAKTSLSIYHCGDLPGYLESALKALSPRRDLPSLDEAFGRSE